MFDNGLLKYHGSLPSYQGFLDVSSIISSGDVRVRRGAEPKIVGGKKYYLKSADYKDISLFTKKPVYDAEILLSQLYAKLGLKTAIYVPATDGQKNFLLSNNIASSNVISAEDHLYPYLGSWTFGESFVDDIPFLSSETKEFVYKPEMFLSRETMRQQSIMRILDVASFNPDRHKANYYYRVSNIHNRPILGAEGALERDLLTESMFDLDLRRSADKENSSSLQPTAERIFRVTTEQEIMDYYRNHKTEDVILIDYEMSGRIMKNMLERPELERKICYQNDFEDDVIPASDFKFEVIENEQLAALIDKLELAEQIGSVNPVETAKDITRTIGYKLDGAMVDTLASSFDDMAEILMQ